MYYIIVNKLAWGVRELACYIMCGWSPLHLIITFLGGGIVLLSVSGD